jgi:threonine/homoserine efflux transporter RhtA
VTLTDLVPTWPIGFDALESLITIFLIAVLKLYRARLMKRRSTYVDRFGWSLIGYDIVFGISALTGVAMTIYPAIAPHVYISRVSTTAVLFAVLWQLTELFLASDERVEAAISGTAAGTHTPPTDKERRVYDRRQETRDMKAELRRYQKGTN